MQRPGYTKAADVTPSDVGGMNPGFTVKALYVGTTGDVAVKMSAAGVSIVFDAVPAGAILPIAPFQVLATGTAASDIVALGD